MHALGTCLAPLFGPPRILLHKCTPNFCTDAWRCCLDPHKQMQHMSSNATHVYSSTCHPAAFNMVHQKKGSDAEHATAMTTSLLCMLLAMERAHAERPNTYSDGAFAGHRRPARASKAAPVFSANHSCSTLRTPRCRNCCSTARKSRAPLTPHLSLPAGVTAGRGGPASA